MRSRGLRRPSSSEVATTRRGDIVRLIVAEGPRFPAIADFYYREVVSRGLAGMRALIELGIARGEIRQQNLARFPQIMVAPAIVAVIWQSLFGKHAPLDAHRDVSRPSRSDFWRTEDDMTSSRMIMRVLAALALAARLPAATNAAIPAIRAGSRPT